MSPLPVGRIFPGNHQAIFPGKELPTGGATLAGPRSLPRLGVGRFRLVGEQALQSLDLGQGFVLGGPLLLFGRPLLCFCRPLLLRIRLRLLLSRALLLFRRSLALSVRPRLLLGDPLLLRVRPRLLLGDPLLLRVRPRLLDLRAQVLEFELDALLFTQIVLPRLVGMVGVLCSRRRSSGCSWRASSLGSASRPAGRPHPGAPPR